MARWNLKQLQVLFYQRSAERIAAGGNKLTYDEVAEAVKMAPATVAYYLDNKIKNPDLDKLAALAGYLGISVAELLIEADDDANPKVKTWASALIDVA